MDDPNILYQSNSIGKTEAMLSVWNEKFTIVYALTVARNVTVQPGKESQLTD